MEKLSYRVTDKAGPRVNGVRVVLGQILQLTVAEARYHLDLAEIEPVSGKAAAGDKG